VSWTEVCRLSEVPQDGVLDVNYNDAPVLLTRDGETVMALEGTCPHAGAPLAKGACAGGELVCPFHHAVFRLRDGGRLAGPGLRDLRRYAVRVQDGRVALGAPSDDAPSAEPGAEPSDAVYAVVGAGAAGLACALALRDLGAAGRVVLFDRDPDPLYERTMLSKGVLAGGMDRAETARIDAGALQRAGIETRFGVEVAAIESSARTLRCADGSSLRYEACFAAPGAAAAPPPWEGGDLKGVHTLRDADDAAAIVAAADAGGRALVIGGGFIGLEASAALASRGAAVTLVAPEAGPFGDAFGADVSRMIDRALEGLGVVRRWGGSVSAFEGADGRFVAARLDDGDRIEADLVIVAIGMAPLGDALTPPVALEDGAAAVDAALQAAPGLWFGGDAAAAGGVASRRRGGHWRVAEADGRRAAAAMLGRPDAAPPEDPPFFWSDIDGPLHMVGVATGEWADSGEVAERSFTRWFLRDGEVVGALGCGDADETAALHALLRRHGAVSAGSLRAADWRAAPLLERPTPASAA
jgi:NADPH-dependent 2,4-dienoyl-CoA reductase/sulfur reductase-like enzyme/nitrite reductase/ring-hydroxylating ferredoxin subunit